MWLYFNSNGQLIKTLEHGNPARVYTTAFKIFAVFENIPDETALLNFEATIKLKKPDLTGSEYPLLLMERASSEFHKLEGETDTEPFQEGHTYWGFLFDFGSFNPYDGEPLLDTNGLWQAIITVISTTFNVQGVATFDVQGTGTEDETTVTYDIVTNQIMHNLPFLVSKKQAIIVIPNIDADVSSYELGQLFYSEREQNIYALIEGATEGTKELELYQNISNIYKPMGSITVDDLNDLTKTSSLNGNVYNMLDAGNLTNEDESTTAVQIGDNVAFIWNNGDWYFDSLVGFVDTSNLVTLNGEQTITGTKTVSELQFLEGDSAVTFKAYHDGEGDFRIEQYTNGVGGEYFEINQLGKFNFTSDVSVSGTIKANANTYDLGTSSYAWQDLYLSGGTYYKYTSADDWYLYRETNYNLSLKYGNNIIYTFQSGAILPRQTNVDLGSSGYKWQDLYLSRYLNLSGFVDSDLRPRYDGTTYDLGDDSHKWKNLYLGGNINLGTYTQLKDTGSYFELLYNENILVYANNSYIQVNRNFTPASDNQRDLGLSSGGRWRNLYLSGNLSDGTNTVTVADIANGIAATGHIYKHKITSTSSSWTNTSLVIINLTGTVGSSTISVSDIQTMIAGSTLGIYIESTGTNTYLKSQVFYSDFSGLQTEFKYIKSNGSSDSLTVLSNATLTDTVTLL